MAATHFSAPCFVLVFALFLHYKTKQTVDSGPEIDAIANGLKFSYIRSLISLNEEAYARHSSRRDKSNMAPELCARNLLYGLLLLCGDVLENPGPAKNLCGLCDKPVKRNQKAVECEECFKWYHVKCTSITAKSYENFGNDSKLVWICNICAFPNFSTTFLLNNIVDITDDNSFAILNSNHSPIGSPLYASSPSKQPSATKAKRRKLKVISLNCNGLKSSAKKSDFHALLDLHEPDIVLGCESKIDSTIPTYSIFPDTYEIFRKDRTLNGGGVFIAIRNDLAAVHEHRLDSDQCEIITVSLQFPRTKKLLISSYYRPPSSDANSLEVLDDFLCNVYHSAKPPQLIIAGDYNCGGIDWHNLDLRKEIPAQPCDRDLLDLTDKYGLTQHVKSPTRPSSGRTLDLVFSSNPNTVQAHHVTPGISDHDAILFEVDLSPKYTPKPPRKVYQFHKADYDGLRFHLSSFSNQYLTSDPGKRSVEENWHKISETIHEAMDKYIPHRMSKAKRHLPWVSASVKHMMNRRDRAHKKARRTGKPKDQVAYKRLRNATVNRVRETHDRYLAEVMGGINPTPTPNSSPVNGIKRAWSYLKLLRTESTGTPTLFWKSCVCPTDHTKAEALREQYESVFTNEDLENMPGMNDSPFASAPDIHFSAHGIKKQLESIQPDKASGPDMIPARVLKETASELAPVLASIFQQSYDTGTLPQTWKDATITPIYKSGPRTDPKNYRPVSLTSLCSKVMEHIVCSEVSRHLSSNNIVTPHQHGFRRGLSCETQLVSVIHEWSKILDTHGQVDIIFLDLAKAFDSVPHERLLLKASYYGIRGKLHTWLRCFLTERKQRVVVNGTSSDWSAVSSGVPQGTVLGPVLFLLYINDLPNSISSTVKLFADDSVVYRQIQRVEDHSILQQDLFNLEQWASLWQMNFAPSKCYTLSVTLKKEPSLFTYSLCRGSQIPKVPGCIHYKFT